GDPRPGSPNQLRNRFGELRPAVAFHYRDGGVGGDRQPVALASTLPAGGNPVQAGNVMKSDERSHPPNVRNGLWAIRFQAEALDRCPTSRRRRTQLWPVVRVQERVRSG